MLPGVHQVWGTQEATRLLRARNNRGTEQGFCFAQPVMCNQGLSQANVSGATETGATGQWASPTTGTGIISFGLAPPAIGNQGFGQATALGATETGGPGQWASPTTVTGINVAGVQGSLGDPRLPPPTGMPPVGVQPIAPAMGLITAPGAYVPAGMPPALAGIGAIPGTGFPPAGAGTGWTGGHGQAGQPPMVGPRGVLGEYFSIGTCLEKLGAVLHGPDLVTNPVWWQRAVSGDSGKISTFTAVVGSLLTFQAFLMMRKGSAMVTTIHSVAKFFSLSTAMFRYQGRYIEFVGNRLAAREPGPVLLPATKSWGWVKKKWFGATVMNWFRHTLVAWNMACCGPPQ